MRGVSRSEPEFLAISPSFNARRFSARPRLSGESYHFKRGAFFWSEPKSLAIFTTLNGRRFSVSAEIPGGFSLFECEAFFGQEQNPRRYCPVHARGVCWLEPKFLAIFQFKCEALFFQNPNSWRYSPVSMRGVFRPKPRPLAVLPNGTARRYLGSTEIPGNRYQVECGAFFGQNQNSW